MKFWIAGFSWDEMEVEAESQCAGYTRMRYNELNGLTMLAAFVFWRISVPLLQSIYVTNLFAPDFVVLMSRKRM